MYNFRKQLSAYPLGSSFPLFVLRLNLEFRNQLPSTLRLVAFIINHRSFGDVNYVNF